MAGKCYYSGKKHGNVCEGDTGWSESGWLKISDPAAWAESEESASEMGVTGKKLTGAEIVTMGKVSEAQDAIDPLYEGKDILRQKGIAASKQAVERAERSAQLVDPTLRAEAARALQATTSDPGFTSMARVAAGRNVAAGTGQQILAGQAAAGDKVTAAQLGQVEYEEGAGSDLERAKTEWDTVRAELESMKEAKASKSARLNYLQSQMALQNKMVSTGQKDDDGNWIKVANPFLTSADIFEDTLYD